MRDSSLVILSDGNTVTVAIVVAVDHLHQQMVQQQQQPRHHQYQR
jgi:hypothetical protein